MSSFPFSFFYYLLLKCNTILKTSFELNCTGTTLLYQSPEAEGGGGEGGWGFTYGLKEHLLSFLIPGHVLKLIF